MTVMEMIKTYYPAVWSKEQIQDLLKNGKITVAEYLTVFPVTEDNPANDELIDLLRVGKLVEIRNVCNGMIENGIDVATKNSGNTTEHFSLDSYSQNNITNMFYSVMAGVEEYPYHADGKECVTYDKEDIVAIYITAQSAITYHTTYNNMLRAFINRTNDVDTLASIVYGIELPEDLATIMRTNIEAAQAQIQKILFTLSGNSVEVKD